MKGIIFTEFLEMVEETFSYQMVDDLLTMESLPSQGIYSAVGTYSHKEIITLVGNLHKKTNIPLTVLLETFGEHLFKSLEQAYGSLFADINNGLDLLNSIEDHIHVQVKKLYPDAELPTFKVIEKTDKKIIMEYTSDRRMADLAVGLIRGCMKHYNEEARISKNLLAEDGRVVLFTIEKI